MPVRHDLGAARALLAAVDRTVITIATNGADAIIALCRQQASSTWEAICNKPNTQTRTA